jgi:hypothetical protein
MPLAQLSSLRGLVLQGQGHQKLQHVMELLSSAVQGCMLKVEVWDRWGGKVQRDQVIAARAALVAEKGSRNVPILVLQDWE